MQGRLAEAEEESIFLQSRVDEAQANLCLSKVTDVQSHEHALSCITPIYM